MSEVSPISQEVAFKHADSSQLYLMQRMDELSHVMNSFEAKLDQHIRDCDGAFPDDHADHHSILKRMIEDVPPKEHAEHHEFTGDQIDNRVWMRHAFYTALGVLGLIGLGAILKNIMQSAG